MFLALFGIAQRNCVFDPPVDSARLAVLDALDARVYADDRAENGTRRAQKCATALTGSISKTHNPFWTTGSPFTRSDVVVEACHCRAEHLPREFHGETFPQPDEAVSNSQTTLPTGI